MSLGLGLGLGLTARGGGSTLAQKLLGSETGMALDFTDLSYATRDDAGVAKGDPNDLLTYSSPSTKYVQNKNGVLVPGTTIRTCYDDDALPLGMVVETAFTALAVPSEFNTWTADKDSGISPVITTGYALAPDGNQTAARITLNKTGGTYARVQKVIGGTSGQPAIFSVWGRTKDGGTSNVGLRIDAAAGANKQFGASFSRQWITVADGTAAPTPQIMLFDSIAGNDETADLVMWGANVGQGTFPTSYVKVPNAGANVTRTADNISLALGSWWSGSGDIITLSGRTALGAGTQVFFQTDDGSEDNRIRIERNSSNEIHCIATVGGEEQCDLNAGTVANDTDFSISFGFAAGDFAASLNGGTPVTASSGSLPTVGTARFGGSFTGEQCCGYLRSIKMVPLS